MIARMGKLSIELSRCPMFERLAPLEIERIANSSRGIRFGTGDLVFRDGQPCEGFYVVLEGAVRVYKIAPDGRQRILHIVRPPNSFAEAAMFGDDAYPAFAEAIEDSHLVLVYREPFLRILREHPDCAVRMFESLSRWLHRLLDQLENETFLNARAKLASYLLREARRRGPSTGRCRVELAVPRKDIASQLGMAPETFSRAQSDLESRGLIEVNGRHVTISDVATLERLLLGEDGSR